MKLSHSAIFLGLTLAFTGCATILGGSSQTLTVNANVEGAEVFLNEQLLGVTPLIANIERGQEGLLRVTAEGYQPYQIALNKKITSLFWVNILSGGGFGSTTDYATGAMYEYEPSTYMVSLQLSEQLGLEERQEWMRMEGLRSFVLLNNEAILSDLANGKGDYLDLLFELLSVQLENHAQAGDRWRAGYTSSNTAAEFADFILAELR